MSEFNRIVVANDGVHKYKIVLRKDGKKVKTIKFGAIGYSDYTQQHKNDERRKRYMDRHKKREDWNDELSAGYYSYNFLWRFKTLQEAKKWIYNDLKKKGYS